MSDSTDIEYVCCVGYLSDEAWGTVAKGLTEPHGLIQDAHTGCYHVVEWHEPTEGEDA